MCKAFSLWRDNLLHQDLNLMISHLWFSIKLGRFLLKILQRSQKDLSKISRKIKLTISIRFKLRIFERFQKYFSNKLYEYLLKIFRRFQSKKVSIKNLLQRSQRFCSVTVTVPFLGVLNRPTSLSVLNHPLPSLTVLL